MPQSKIPIALINNSPTPYRTHLHLRLVSELPAASIWSVFTHQYSNASWDSPLPDIIKPICFGPSEESAYQSHPLRQVAEWKKAGRIIDWMITHQIAAVVLGGYNDCGLLRILHWCRQSRIPCFVFGDSNVLADKQSGFKAWLKRRVLPVVLRRASGAMHCGRHGASYFARYGVPSSRLFPLPYEPDYGAIQQVPEEFIAKTRERYQLDSQRRYILFCGRLTAVKRPELLVQAFLQVASQRPSWDLLLVGGGPLQQTLETFVPADLTARIHFTGFVNDPVQIAALYRTVDVLALPSDYEPWGVVVTEAAVCLALVCSDHVGAAADLLQEGVNGRSFRAGEVNSLIAALLDVTADENIDRMKTASPGVLAQWRRRTDPVAGLRAALASAGLSV